MIAADPLCTVELLALIEESTAPMRHDVRNRIASVRNLAFFVRRKLSSESNVERDPRVNEFLLKIEGEVQRTDEVIDAWAARVQGVRTLEAQSAQVVVAVRLAMDAARLPAGIEFALHEPDEPLRVEGDFDTLALAVRCLLENAGQAIGSGVVRVQITREAERCHITVIDRGPGIVDRARCLERFESTKPGHLGLGLCMARRIATRFGGELVVGSPEQGAEVSIRIPIAVQRPTGEP